MKTKLTLSVDRNLVAVARQQARKQGASISGMFAAFVLAQKRAADDRVKPGVGSLKDFAIDDSKEGVRKAYAQKNSR